MATFPTKYGATEQLAGVEHFKIVEESDNEMQDIAMFYLPGTAGFRAVQQRGVSWCRT